MFMFYLIVATGHHLDTTFQEQNPSPELVNSEDGNQGGGDVNNTGDNRGHEGSIILESQKHDHVDPSELLEEGYEGANHELWPVPGLEDIPPWMFHLLGSLTCLKKVLELLVNVVSAANPLQHFPGLLRIASLQDGVWSIGQKEGTNCDHHCRDPSES
ncbi:hypothetical protein TorRG33x02_007340 [Trema orientale]|uniref:Uncharacterized protein n=1 Tax=Trema orientale TaxID=63057 RepID=A0A2P5G0J0_TREOI|nr:hypothetical protein TorRG33x02_007340 [Trema orientale]